MNRHKYLAGQKKAPLPYIYKDVLAGQKYIEKEEKKDVFGRRIPQQVVTIRSWHPSETPLRDEQTGFFKDISEGTNYHFSYFIVEENPNVKYFAERFIKEWELISE